MKLFVRVLSVILLVLTLTLTLASCGSRVSKGEYVRGDKVLEGYYESYTFKGKKFSFDVYRGYQHEDALSYTGTYKLVKDKENSDKDEGITVGTITLTYTDANGNEVVEEKPFYMEDTEEVLLIKIDGVFYNYFEE